jgi:hypothetical protein
MFIIPHILKSYKKTFGYGIKKFSFAYDALYSKIAAGGGKEVFMMANTNIYQDIAARTGGDIYIGVVGPVRTGKSTFIKKFMETLVIPNIKNEYDRTRAKDEMPQ